MRESSCNARRESCEVAARPGAASGCHLPSECLALARACTGCAGVRRVPGDRADPDVLGADGGRVRSADGFTAGCLERRGLKGSVGLVGEPRHPANHHTMRVDLDMQLIGRAPLIIPSFGEPNSSAAETH
jgi:hypothetical protein